MIKALENPHFKKIWEALYPNLLAGRESELSSFNGLCDECLLVVNKPLNEQWHTFKGNIMTNLEFKFINQDRYDDEKYTIAQILGRPINLENILQLEINSQSFPSWDEEHIKQGTLVYINNMIMLGLPSKSTYINLDDSAYGNCFCADWQLTKPLHEQSENTWEKLSELINQK
jgi:hypothetical protein